MKNISDRFMLLLRCARGVLRRPKKQQERQPKPPSALDKYIEQASQPEAADRPDGSSRVAVDSRRRGSRIWRRINARGASMTSSPSWFRKAPRR